MMNTITVTWKAFSKDGNYASKTIETSTTLGVQPEMICEFIFRDTNTYQGSFWTLLQPLPENRTHTALSVGDEVTIDGRTFRCADIGFEEIQYEVVECPNHEGAFDCTPFCRLCEGEQEYRVELDNATTTL
jgi:hypothetical protein